MTVFWTFLLFIFVVYAIAPTPGEPDYRMRCAEWPWKALARIVSRERVRKWIIRAAMARPYTHLPGYMDRYWVFNPYDKINGNEVKATRWLPSVRVHHILRRDEDRHLHDHPWNARTIILGGCYEEHRLEDGVRVLRRRRRGSSARINFGEYHAITAVSPGGVWTLFITFGYRGTWGFLVDGKKVPWRDYMDLYPEKPWAEDDKAAQ